MSHVREEIWNFFAHMPGQAALYLCQRERGRQMVMAHLVVVLGMVAASGASKAPMVFATVHASFVAVVNGVALFAQSLGAHLIRLAAGSTPTFTPTGGAPGSGAVQKLLDWGGWFALAASLGGLIIGAGMWAHSSSSGSYGGVHKGKQYVLGGAVGALVLGVAPILLSTLYSTGQN
jgi:hypothetical protein